MNLLFLFLSFSASVWAFDVPTISGPVEDQARIMTVQARQEISRYLREVHALGGPQIQVLTLTSLSGVSIEEATIKITDQFKLGGRESDNGVLLLLAMEERKVRIEVGLGLQGEIPDIYASRIIREIILPNMRRQDPDHAIGLAVAALVKLAAPDLKIAGPDATIGPNWNSEGRTDKVLFGERAALFLFVFIFFTFMIIGRFLGRSPFGRSAWYGGGWGSSGGGWAGGGGGFNGGGASGGW